MATAVVTGGAGFLGSHLSDHLMAKGLRAICVDNLETGSLQNVEHLRGDAFTFMHHDVTEHSVSARSSSSRCSSSPGRS
jgi:dTDP-glucose 4,6-dehydratase